MAYQRDGAGGWRAAGNFVAPLVESEVAPAPPARRRQSVRPPRNDGEASKSRPAGREEAAASSPSLAGEKGKGSAQVGARDAASSKRSSQKKKEGGAPKAAAVGRAGGPPRREQQIAPQLKEAEDACEELEAPRAKAAPPPPVVRRKTGSGSRRAKALPEEEDARREKEVGCEGKRRSRRQQQKGARGGGDGPASPGAELQAQLWGFQDEARAEGRARTREVEPKEEAPPVEPVLRRVLERLRLARREVSEASAQVNEVEKMLVETVKELCGSAVEPLRTGSYYERVKVCHPDEFDIMLIIKNLRVELEPCNCEAASGAFCYVKLPQLPRDHKLRKFLNADQQLSSTELLSDLRRIIGDKVKKMEGGKISLQKTKPTSPAITLLLKAPPADISIDFTVALELRLRPKVPEGGLAIGEWLGTKAKREFSDRPSYVVPKTLQDGRLLRENTWRLSFSHIEKLMINNHGHTKTCCEASGEKCCRKNCLKLLKYLLEQLKEKHKQRNQFNQFFSYHAKTAFFHACSIWPKDADWKKEDLAVCFDRLLNFFLDCLRKTELNHFFIPDFNFFSAIRIERGKCAILARVIEQERNNGFPIFKENLKID